MQAALDAKGVGDMLTSVYDPLGQNNNAFSMDYMIESSSLKIFTSVERAKLSGIETAAEVNNISDANATDLTDAGDSALHYHATDRARANHTGTQAASTISDFDTEVANNTAVASNTTHRGLTNNPHTVTAAQVSLGNVDNVADANQTAVGTIGTGVWEGTAINQTYLVGQSGTNTGDEAAASTTVAGVAELATTAEIDTGTDSTRTMPVDQFVASKRNIRWLTFNLVEAGTDCAAATNIAGDFVSPIAGTILQSDTTPFYIYATNSTAGVTGTMVVDVNINGTSIMTTNKLDFDTGEKTTTTAATPPDLTTTTLAVGDIITIDIDSIHTTAAKGLTVYIGIRE